MRERDFSIDIIKCLAVFMIVNSHADIAFPQYKIFATGGAIGDALFLFCSGYTIFLGKMRDFGNYYKRRISRIYPSSVGCLVIMMLLPWWSNNFEHNFLLFSHTFLYGDSKKGCESPGFRSHEFTALNSFLIRNELPCSRLLQHKCCPECG